jgi:holo-[acyl-carrier protein] synthase
MIGVDVTSIDRFKKIKKGDYLHWEKFFNETEWQYAFGLADPSEHLAGIFAAKEAVMKALGGDFVKRFDCIHIEHAKDGKPIVRAKIAKKGKKGREKERKVEISISHEKNIAVAVALVVK